MQLKLGKMNNQEIANWFGIKKTTYSARPKFYLKKMEDFADFEQVYGGVVIKEIYKAEYDRKFSTKIDQIYLHEVQKNSGFSSVSGIAEKYSLSRRQVANSRDRLFGLAPLTVDQDAHGILGTRDYVWAIKLYDGPNCYRALSRSEMDLFDGLITGYYDNLTPAQIKLNWRIERSCREQNLSIEQMNEVKSQFHVNFYEDVLLSFREETDKILVLITYHEFINNLALEEDEKTYRDKLMEEYDKCAWDN